MPVFFKLERNILIESQSVIEMLPKNGQCSFLFQHKSNIIIKYKYIINLIMYVILIYI